MNGGRRNRRWQKGGYTLNEPKRYDIATVRSPERKKRRAESAVIQKEDTPNTPEGTISPRFRQPERNEAAGSGGDRSQMAYKAHLKQKKNFTTIRWPPRSGAGGTDGSKGKVGTC